MKILTVPDKRLAETAKSVTFRGGGALGREALGRLIMGMLDAMYAHEGVGLAAPQIGAPWRVICVDPVGERHQAKVLINPRIWWRSTDTVLDVEGCLSVPGEFGVVERAKQIRLHYQDRDGLAGELEVMDDPYLARVIQHECDHLEGVLFTSKLDTP